VVIEANDAVQNRLHLAKRSPGIYSRGIRILRPVPADVKKKERVIMYSDNLLQTGYVVREWSDVLDYVYTMKPRMRLQRHKDLKADIPYVGGDLGSLRCFAYDIKGLMSWIREGTIYPIYFYPTGTEICLVQALELFGTMELLCRTMYVIDYAPPEFRTKGIWMEQYEGKTYFTNSSAQEKMVRIERRTPSSMIRVSLHFNSEYVEGTTRSFVGQTRPGIFKIIERGKESQIDLTERDDAPFLEYTKPVTQLLKTLMAQYFRNKQNMTFYGYAAQRQMSSEQWDELGVYVFEDVGNRLSRPPVASLKKVRKKEED